MKISELNMVEFVYDIKRNSYKRKEGRTNREYRKIICDKCKKECLVRFGSKSKYCSRSCSQKDKKRPQTSGDKHGCWKGGISSKTHPCVDCGKEIKLNAKRCRPCTTLYQKGINSPRWKGGISSKTHPCVDCGKEIGNKSHRCRQCFNKINKGENNAMFGRKGKQTNRWKNDIIERHCEVCGKTFPRGEKVSKVCIKCYKDEHTPAYIDGRSKSKSGLYDYKDDFRNTLKNKIKQRDNYKCQYPNCQGSYNTLCVHHIDYDKQNSSENNLITLCCSCHIKTNYRREYHENLMRNILNEREKIG